MYEPDFDVDEENNSIADAESPAVRKTELCTLTGLCRGYSEVEIFLTMLHACAILVHEKLVQGKTFQFTFPAADGTSRTVEAYCSTSSKATRASAYLYNGLYRGFKFDVIGTGA